MDEQEILVDIPMCAYNHGKYIAQAIEGIVLQKTSFRFRLLIGEDCSTDNTRAVIVSYLEKYPDKLKAIFHEKNIGPFENSRILFSECKAKYIALCDGDDFWTDLNKLQKQIEFLEANPKYVGCFHNSEERYEDQDDKASFLYCNYSFARSISFSDLSYSNVIPTCSVVYCNNLFKIFPEWYSKLKMGDWPLHLLNSQFGEYWYIPKVMGVHRLHRESIWMLRDADRNNNYIEEAYDIMIKGFESDKIFADYLVIGKENFVKSLDVDPRGESYRQKAKRLMIRMIEKL